MNVHGCYLETLEEFKNLIDLIVAQAIKPKVGLVLPLNKAEFGCRRITEGKTDGKIVVAF